MREILFRFWDKNRKRMIVATDIRQRLPHATHEGWLAYGDDGIGGEVGGEHISELMQYTGLKDKHGVKIFEGDVCRFSGWKPKPILWRDGRFWLGNSLVICSKIECDDMTILGNVHDNPDLLEGGE